MLCDQSCLSFSLVLSDVVTLCSELTAAGPPLLILSLQALQASMVGNAGDSDTKRHDDTELEIESHALHNLDSAAALDRRSSLDRSHTMPAPSWEEGDQILRVRLDVYNRCEVYV